MSSKLQIDPEIRARQILRRLETSSGRTAQTIVITRAYLDSLPRPQQRACWAVSILHWFDVEILSALLPHLGTAIKQVYAEIQQLPFVESYFGRGFNLHDLQRQAMLGHLWRSRRTWYKEISGRAADYFARQNNYESQIEEIYHLLISHPDAGAQALKELRWRWADGADPTNFSRVEATARTIAEHGRRLPTKAKDWVKLWTGFAGSRTAYEQARIERTLASWLKRRSRTRQDLEDHLQLDFDFIARFLTTNDKGIGIKVANFLDMPVGEFEHRQEFYRSEQHALDVDAGLMDWSEVEQGVSDLARLIVESGLRPDYIIGVHDPEAMGGATVAGMLRRHLTAQLGNRENYSPTLGNISIAGRIGSTRKVAGAIDLPSSVKSIIIVDDVSLSGNTLRLAKRFFEKRYPTIDIHTAVLFASRSLIEHEDETSKVCDFFAKVTERETVLFPWGSVRLTGELNRFFHILPGERKVTTAGRPWGRYEEFALNEKCTVRILTVYPEQRLSLQRHRRRDELFVALDEGILVQVGTDWIEPAKGDYILISRGTWHRLGIVDGWKEPVRVLEIGFGKYDQVRDIERREDFYGRVDLDGSV